MVNCKSVSTPLAAHFELSAEFCPQFQKDIEKMSHVPYSSTVGSLIYAMVCTRPDLLYAMSVVRPGNWVIRFRFGSGWVGSGYVRVGQLRFRFGAVRVEFGSG